MSTDFDEWFTFNSDPCYCSGNGNYTSCLQVGYCVCNPGWTGRADFSRGQYSCHINNYAVIFLWSLVLLAMVISFVLSFSKVKLMLIRFVKVKQRMKKKGKTLSLSTHRGLMVVLIIYLIIHPLLATLAILRIVDEDQRIGLSIPMTVLWTLVIVTFAMATHRYTTAIATAMLKAEESTNKYIARGRWFGRSLLFCQSACTLLAYPVLINDGQSKLISRLCMIFYLIWSMFVCFVMSYWFKWVKKQVFVVLTDDYVDLRRKMNYVVTSASTQALLNGIFFGIIVCIPILWTVSLLHTCCHHTH
jgi:hypothetical protein